LKGNGLALLLELVEPNARFARWSGVVNGSLGYIYDSDLRLAATTVNGGLQASFGYDDDGLLTRVGDLTLTRDARNALVTSTDVGVVHEEYGYNGFGEVTSFAAQAGGETLLAMQYERDGLGRITRKVETIAGVTATYDYGYDAANRVQQVTRDGVIASWTYDGNGNRTSETKDGSTVAATYDGQDRLLTYGTTSYSYGNAGEVLTRKRLIESAPTQYRYDALGNLVGATLPDGTVLGYVVDARNRRVGKEVNGTLVRGFLWEDQLRIAAETDGSGHVVSRFIYGTGVNVPELVVKEEAVYRVIRDHLGSPRLVVNTGDGAVVQRIDYDEWGKVTRDTNPGFQPFGFAGGLCDLDTLLVRFGYRYYDPSTGRFFQPEPLLRNPRATVLTARRGVQMNAYVYAANNSVNWVDPNGLEVVNRSNRDVLVKPEDGPWGRLPPGRTYPGKCDGVIGPNGRMAVPGKWWLPDNKVVVNKDGVPECRGGLCALGEKEWPSTPDWTPPADPPVIDNVPSESEQYHDVYPNRK
jgi:RHS repeat-associated protein